jgi:chromosome segregation ATPase
MNDETLNRRLDSRASVFGADTPSVDTLCKVFLDFQAASKKWRSGANSSKTGEVDINSTKRAHSALVKEILRHQHDIEKANKTLLRCRKESKYYADLTENTHTEMSNTQKEIDVLKVKLQEARKRREEKIEYEKKCRIINQYPSRERLNEQIGGLKQKLLSVQKETEEANKNLQSCLAKSKAFFKAYHELGKEFGISEYIVQQENALLNDTIEEEEDNVTGIVGRKRVRDDEEETELQENEE